MKHIKVQMAIDEDEHPVRILTDKMEVSVVILGSEIIKQFPAFIIQKIKDGKAVIAVTESNIWIGFSYIKIYKRQSGMLVAPAYRIYHVAKPFEEKILELLNNPHAYKDQVL